MSLEEGREYEKRAVGYDRNASREACTVPHGAAFTVEPRRDFFV